MPNSVAMPPAPPPPPLPPLPPQTSHKAWWSGVGASLFILILFAVGSFFDVPGMPTINDAQDAISMLIQAVLAGFTVGKTAFEVRNYRKPKE